MSNDTCKDCKYWMRQGTEYGTCQRNPPQVRIQYSARLEADYTGKRSEFVTLNAWGTHEGEFPTTHQGTWCGEHRPEPSPRQAISAD